MKKPFRITRNGVFQPGDTSRLGRKGFPAATTLARIGIRNFETSSSQAITEIHHCSPKVLRAEWVYQHRNPVHFAREIIRSFLVKNHPVFHPRTTPFLNVDPKYLSVIL